MSAVGSSAAERALTPLTGGLDTRVPPTRMPDQFSPDLDNVTLNQEAVEKRGGFTPFIRQHPRLNAVVNRGFRRAAKVKGDDVTAVLVPGRLLAGDRAHYEDVTTVTLDFFVRPDDLTGKAALADLRSETIPPGSFNDRYASIPDGDVKVSIRPIISKGPSKRANAQHRDITQQYADRYGWPSTARGYISWDPTHTWGPGAHFHACTTAGGLAGVATSFTTRQPHGLTTGDGVRLFGGRLYSLPVYDGVYAVTVTGPSTFTIIPTANVVAGEVTAVSQPDVLGHAMPWAVYLWNEGTKDQPLWRFELATHGCTDNRDPATGLYVLRTLRSTIDVEKGATYHVLASIDWTDRMVLRVGRWNAVDRQFDYTAVELDLSGDNFTPPRNPVGPVQIFDVPIEFVETSNVSSRIWNPTTFSSRPPGLNLAEQTNGGYYSELKRFEGAIEDIAIWNTALLSTSDASRDRSTKINLPEIDATELLNFWPMTDGSDRVIREATGRGNHLYFAPDFPILDTDSGGIRSDRKASWWFNGSTSYAIADLDGNPNWRERERYDEGADLELVRAGTWSMQNSAAAGWLQKVVTLGGDIGIQVEFQIDALEPFEQVLAEIHNVMRCTVRADGRLQLYYRDQGLFGVLEFRHRYQPLVYSTLVVKPGSRYAVQFVLADGKARIAVNGAIDSEVTFVAPVDSAGQPIGGFTIGMGGRRPSTSVRKTDVAGITVDADKTALVARDVDVGDVFSVIGTTNGNTGRFLITSAEDNGFGAIRITTVPELNVGSDAGTVAISSKGKPSTWSAPENGINTDFRSGFLGRIESVKILAGNSLESVTSIRDESTGDWRFPIVPLYKVPAVQEDSTGTPPYAIASRDTIAAIDDTTEPGTVIAGQGVRVHGVRNVDAALRDFPDLRTNTDPNIAADSSIEPPIPFDTGVENDGAAVDVYFVIAHWLLDRSFEDTNIIGGRFRNRVEYRQPAYSQPLAPAVRDVYRYVARQETTVTDDVGHLGPLEARCLEPDIITEAENEASVGFGNTAPTREWSAIRGRIWQELSLIHI